MFMKTIEITPIWYLSDYVNEVNLVFNTWQLEQTYLSSLPDLWNHKKFSLQNGDNDAEYWLNREKWDQSLQFYHQLLTRYLPHPTLSPHT